MQNAYLVFDIGTGNTRVALVGEDGAILDIAKENTRMYPDPIASRAQYFKPHEWQDAVFSLIRKLLAAHPDVTVRAVTGSTLRQGIVLVGHDGRSIVGYTNADRRGEGFMQELDWKRIWELTDLSPSPIFSAIKILGTSKLQPQVLEQTKFYTSISDWMGYVFTGRAVWERAQAMQSALYDAVNGCWSQELCDLIGVDIGKLPELADAGTVLGPIRPEICQTLGLAGEPVFVVGAADTQSAISAMQAEVGELVTVSGTTSPTLKIITDFCKYPRTWVSPTAEPGRLMLEVNTASSGINLQRFKDTMLKDMPYEHLNEDAAQRGLPERNLPGMYAVFLTGMHLDQDLLTGGFVMSNPISVDTKPEDYFHALTLNIGMSISMCIEKMKTLQPLEHDYLIGCGGGFSSPVVGQTVADLTGLKVRIFDNWREATVYGGYVLCCRATGKPVPARRQIAEICPKPSQALERYYRNWKEMREHFKEFKLK